MCSVNCTATEVVEAVDRPYLQGESICPRPELEVELHVTALTKSFFDTGALRPRLVAILTGRGQCLACSRQSFV